MTPKFWLTFSKSQPFIYHSGQNLEATLCVEIPEESQSQGQSQTNNLNWKEIVVVIKGKSKCNWTEGRHEKRGEEIFFRKEFRTNLVDRDDVFALSPGVHEYNLTFNLPPDLPCTFKGSKGQIYYEAQVKISPPSLLEFSKANRFPFEVRGQLDIFGVEALTLPVELEERWSVWEPFGSSCCCLLSQINCIISVPKTGLVFGQILKFTMQIHNKSRKSVRQLFVQLMQEVTYTANHNWNVKCKKMNELINVQIEPPGEAKMKGPCEFICVQQIQIPNGAIPITSSGRCNIVKICYLLKFTVKLGCFYTMTKILPIVIGNIDANGAIAGEGEELSGGGVGDGQNSNLVGGGLEARINRRRLIASQSVGNGLPAK